MKKGFKEVDARFDGVESRLDKVEASQQRTQALVEEMKTQNQIVYDRVDSLNESIENVRTELKQDYQNIMDVLSKISAAQNK